MTKTEVDRQYPDDVPARTPEQRYETTAGLQSTADESHLSAFSCEGYLLACLGPKLYFLRASLPSLGR